MSNLKNLKTNHYKSKLIYTKKIKIKNTTYLGFKINDLFTLKEFIKNKNIIDFTYKGLSFINKNNLKSTLQNI
tara:strand:- start:1040 stop:1258 length:219 start_codon:yes stop_codon:yes gene_type:complete